MKDLHGLVFIWQRYRELLNDLDQVAHFGIFFW